MKFPFLLGLLLGGPVLVFSQLQVGNPFELPMFLSSGYLKDQYPRNVELFYGFAQRTEPEGRTRIQSIGIRRLGQTKLPWFGEVIFGMGAYYQNGQFGPGFLKMDQPGITLSVSKALADNQWLFIMGAGAYFQRWQADWSEFSRNDFLSSHYGLDSLAVVGPWTHITQYGEGDFSFSLNAQYRPRKRIYLTFGTESKNLARHYFLPVLQESYRTPVQVGYYLQTTLGLSPISDANEGQLYLDGYLAYSHLTDNFVNAFLPFRNFGEFRDGIATAGLKAHLPLNWETYAPIGLWLQQTFQRDEGEFEGPPSSPPVPDTSRVPRQRLGGSIGLERVEPAWWSSISVTYQVSTDTWFHSVQVSLVCNLCQMTRSRPQVCECRGIAPSPADRRRRLHKR